MEGFSTLKMHLFLLLLFSVKPRIDQLSLPKNIKIKVGQKFSIPVSFIGEPNPTVTWKAKNLVSCFLSSSDSSEDCRETGSRI